MDNDQLQTFKELLMLVAGGISTWVITNIRPRRVAEDEHDKSQNSTIEIQGRTLADAWTMIEKLQAQVIKQDGRIKELDTMLVKYSKALYRANKFINEHVTGVSVPDFLLDTDPKISKPPGKAAAS